MVDLTEAQDLIAEMKGIPTKEELINLLKEKVVEVTFTKLNGDERVMPCTLQELYLPPAQRTVAKEPHEKNINVWAMEANAFRSFHYDRVKSVKVINWHFDEKNA